MEKILTIIMLIIFIASIGWTIYLKWPQFRVFKEVGVFIKKYPNHPTYKTFLVSLATNLGTGNLVGVTTGIIMGGPGVIIWMWIFGFFSSALSYIENVYAVKYQEKIGDEYRGGACYYILKGLNNPILSIIFAVFLLLTNTIFFPPIQVNTILSAIAKIFPFNKYIIGLLLIIFLLTIVFKGTKKIVDVTNKIVPVMTITFMTTIIFLMIMNYHTFIDSIIIIFNSAFNIKSMGIGLIINAISVGIRRSLFSHEAGLGTMPSVTGMSEAPTPDIQGYFGMLGVYVDTLIMCTITGIFIVQMQMDYSKYDGADLLIEIFVKNFGNIGLLIGVIFLFIFAFSSLLGQYYLGESNAMLFTKFFKRKNNLFVLLYRLVFTIGISLGIVLNMNETIELVDIGLLILGLFNLIILFMLEKSKNACQNKK
ncbi:MAG: amino acid carrier protein [Bacilli bacterium]|nr:amino acid carrier protein [Bacilli bacterium]